MRRLVAWLIAAAYFLRLRRPLNSLQRWLAERNAPRSVLPRFMTPEQMVRYAAAKFAWRKDKLARWLPVGDWSSHPQVFQARLEAPGDVDGDCDDYHAWCCELLERMPGVTDIMRMSCWTSRRGHTTAVFTQNGKIHLIDYDIVEVDSYQEALDVVRFRHDWDRDLSGWVFETTDLELVAVWPNLPAPGGH